MLSSTIQTKHFQSAVHTLGVLSASFLNSDKCTEFKEQLFTVANEIAPHCQDATQDPSNIAGQIWLLELMTNTKQMSKVQPALILKLGHLQNDMLKLSSCATSSATILVASSSSSAEEEEEEDDNDDQQ